MKKLICLILVICAITCCMTSCAVVQSVLLGIFAGNTETDAKVEEMVSALSENRPDDAVALMHPEARETARDGINDMIKYIGGKTVESMQMTGYYVNSKVSTAGSVTQEDITYYVSFTDGSSIGIEAVYVNNVSGQGFYKFVLTLGSTPDGSTDDGNSSESI